MEPLDSLNRWTDRLRDRARAGTFARFLAKRFLDERLFQAAAALAYTTLFALVPLAMVVFGVLSAFSAFQEWSVQLRDYVFANFVPGAAEDLKDTLNVFLSNTGKLTALGVVALMISLLITLNSIEATFNRIWRVSSARPKLSRFLVYWTVLTLGALMAAASLALSARFYALPVFATTGGKLLQNLSLSLAPMVIELVAITAIYRVVPHRTIKWRYAIAGALLATVLLELIKWALGIYLGSFNTYQKVYGALAAAPILLLVFVYGKVADVFETQFSRQITLTTQRLAVHSEDRGRAALQREITQLLSDQTDIDAEMYLLLDEHGRKLAGNLDVFAALDLVRDPPQRARAVAVRRQLLGDAAHCAVAPGRLSDTAAALNVMSGRPAASTALRARFMPAVPAVRTQPMTASSIAAGSMPAREQSGQTRPANSGASAFLPDSDTAELSPEEYAQFASVARERSDLSQSASSLTARAATSMPLARRAVTNRLSPWKATSRTTARV